MDILCAISGIWVCESPDSIVDSSMDVRGSKIPHAFNHFFLLYPLHWTDRLLLKIPQLIHILVGYIKTFSVSSSDFQSFYVYTCTVYCSTYDLELFKIILYGI